MLNSAIVCLEYAGYYTLISNLGEGVGRMLTTLSRQVNVGMFYSDRRRPMKGKSEAQQKDCMKQRAFERVGPPIEILKGF